MKLLILISFLFSSVAVASQCAPVPNGPNGKPVQTFKALTGQDEPRGRYEPTIYGEDLIYQGEQCPAGKICIESIYSIYGNIGTTHGQVIVIDSATGNVEQLLPIRTKTNPAPEGQPLSQSGIRTYNPDRLVRTCAELNRADSISSNFCRSVNRRTGEISTTAQNNLDTYSYGLYNGARLVSGEYVPLTAESRVRTIQALNSGNRTNSVAFLIPRSRTNITPTADENGFIDWSQVNSIQRGSAGTVGRLSRLVGEVRKRLGCEPIASNPQLRLRQAALDSREGLSACGLRFDPGNGIDTKIECERTPCSLTRPILVNLTQTSSSEYECKSKFRGDVETINCKYRDINARITQTFQVQNGRLLAIAFKDSTQRGEFNCALAAPTRPTRTQRPGSGSRVNEQ